MLVALGAFALSRRRGARRARGPSIPRENVMANEALVEELMGALVAVADEPGAPVEDDEGSAGPALPEGLDESLRLFLKRFNGGYTKDSYFHFFGTREPRQRDLFTWNEPELWKKYYGLGGDWFFFAEDAFGNQFGCDLKRSGDAVQLLWVDDGRLEAFADSFEDFIEFTVFDPDNFKKMRELSENVYRLAGTRLPRFQHIAYRKPLLLGGSASDLRNLEFAESGGHLRLVGQIVQQVKKLPKGTRIKQVLLDRERGEIKLVPDTAR
jgi:hypothetical protein